MKRVLALGGAAVLALGLVLVLANPLAAEDLPVLTPGSPAPDFGVADVKGALEAGLAERVAVVATTGADA